MIGSGSRSDRRPVPAGSFRRAVVLVGVALFALPAGLAAQQQGDLPALRKSDVVLMLTSRDLSQEELTSIIRSRCLTFEPTPGDLDDFRRLGAGEEVIDAVEACAAGEADAEEAEPAPPVTEPATPSLALAGTRFGPDGGETIRVRVTRGGAPAAGVPVALLARPADTGSAQVLARGSSGAGGTVALRVPPGRMAEGYLVRVTGGGGGPTLEVMGAYGEASVTPLPFSLSVPLMEPGPGLAFADPVPLELGGAPGVGVEVEGRAAGEAAAEPGGMVIRFESAPETEGRPADAERSDAVSALLRRAAEHRRAGELYLAKKALRSAVQQAPRDTAVRRRFRELRNVDRRTWVEGTVWGGGTSGELDFRSGAGLQALEIRVSPVRGTFSLRYRFDDGLNLRHPELVRGPTAYRSHFGGLSLRYGDGSWETRAEVGRRRQPTRPFNETTVTVEQSRLLGPETLPEFERTRIGVDATWGRWGSSVEHDLFFGAFAGFPVSPIFRAEVAVHYSEGIGTVPSAEQWQSRARELRLEVRPVLRSGASRLELGLAYGSVEAVPDEVLGREEGDPRFSGSLWNTEVRGTLPLGDAFRLEGFYRWQSAPGYPSFSTFGLGLSTGFPY